MKRSMRDRSLRKRAGRIGCRAAAIVTGLVSAGLLASSGVAGPNLFVGVDDNAFLADPATSLPVARDLGMTAVRVTIDWHPGKNALSQNEASGLRRLTADPAGMRIVASVFSTDPYRVPLDAVGRDQYCTFVGDILKNYPTINDVAIWNEPNLSYFWRPQFNADGSSAAPAAYEALLARCYDVLHAIRPGVNVIGPATCPRGNDIAWDPQSVSHSPGQFILGMGRAYRASGRQRPIFDTVGHHIYGTFSAERPWRVHSSSTAISQGDWSALMSALSQAFQGTAQRIPGECSGGSCVSIWYLEAGYQTTIDPTKARAYTGFEPWQHLVPAVGGPPDPLEPAETSWAPNQATQIRDGIRLAYCQPYVGAFFNFLLRDEADLARWQSGPLWADGTPKPSYPAFKQVIADVNKKGVDCRKLSGDQSRAGVNNPSGRSPSAVRRPLRLALSVRRKVLAGSVMRVWLRFNRVVTNEHVQLQRLRGKRFHVIMGRKVSGFAPTLDLWGVKSGHYTIRVVYRDGSRSRQTRNRHIAVVQYLFGAEPSCAHRRSPRC
jgi:hypothetical protein